MSREDDTQRKKALESGRGTKSNRKRVADTRMSEKSTRGDGTYTPTIQVGLETPLTLDMETKRKWKKYYAVGANDN